MTATTKTRPRPGAYDEHILAILQESGSPLTSSNIASRVADRLQITPRPFIEATTIGVACRRMEGHGKVQRHTQAHATSTTGFRWSVKKGVA